MFFFINDYFNAEACLKNFVLSNDELRDCEIDEPSNVKAASAAKINAQTSFSPDQLIFLFQASDWEEFIKEWAHFQKQKYQLVSRMGGANDYGIDVACFLEDNGFLGEWDCYQCKKYKDSLAPSDVIPEIGKLLWHIFSKNITKPSAYYFFAPKDCGPSLKKLLLNTEELKAYFLSNWEAQCSKSITSKSEIKLEGEFKKFVDEFDYSIFRYKPTHEVIDDHKKTPYHLARFGGGLGTRPDASLLPADPTSIENRYIEQLLEAYSDCGAKFSAHSDLEEESVFKKHFDRSRECFYKAEDLHRSARDSVPNGTFERLQDEVLFGVKDTEEENHENAFKRVKEVTKMATTLNVQANGLHGWIEVKDLQGICHQLSNENRLIWKKS